MQVRASATRPCARLSAPKPAAAAEIAPAPTVACPAAVSVKGTAGGGGGRSAGESVGEAECEEVASRSTDAERVKESETVAASEVDRLADIRANSVAVKDRDGELRDGEPRLSVVVAEMLNVRVALAEA